MPQHYKCSGAGKAIGGVEGSKKIDKLITTAVADKQIDNLKKDALDANKKANNSTKKNR